MTKIKISGRKFITTASGIALGSATFGLNAAKERSLTKKGL